MRGAGGYALIELLVASACAALTAAAALSLLVHGAAWTARAQGRTGAVAIERACVDQVLTDVGAAGSGLEGARSVRAAGTRHDRIEPRLHAVRLLLAMERPLEVTAVNASTYLVGGGVRVPSPGAAVVALPGTAYAGSPPLGHVHSAVEGADAAGLRIIWSAAELAQITAHPPRAVVPVVWREYEVVGVGAAFALRRRDDNGPWQPVVDGLIGIEFAYLLDDDGDGLHERVDEFAEGEAAAAVGLRVRCEATNGTSAAEGWSRGD